MKRHQCYIFIAVTTLALITACGGSGSSDTVDTNNPANEPTPAGGSITLETCTPATVAVGVSRYSRVFKGCNNAGVAQYYELDECVRDDSTGLIWQGQTPAGTGLRANDQYKSNFDSTTSLQKWTGTGYVAPTTEEINDINNSIGYKNAVNASRLCGSDVWRLPTKDELLNIVKTSESPMIDNAAFPNTSQNYAWYWSSSAYEGGSYRTTAAWDVNFIKGNADADNRNINFGNHFNTVRLVR